MKKVTKYRYIVMVPVCGTFYANKPGIFNGEDEYSLDYDQIGPVYDEIKEDINEWMQENKDDLAKYLPGPECHIKGVPLTELVESIETDCVEMTGQDELFLKLSVVTSKEIDEVPNMEEALKEYLRGQMSDGWGENFIQGVNEQEQEMGTTFFDENDYTLHADTDTVKTWLDLEPVWANTSIWTIGFTNEIVTEEPETLEEANEIILRLKRELKA